MQSIKALPGRLAVAAFPRLFAPPVKISRSKHSHRRMSGGAALKAPKGNRKILKIERPTWRDKFRRGEAPTKQALIALSLFYVCVGILGFAMGDASQKMADAGQQVAATAARGFGFGIREIRVEGGTRLTDAEITKILDISSASSAFTVDTEETRLRFLEIPWIKSASVRLVMPGTLQVNLTERTPHALWQLGGNVVMLDREGRSIGPYNDQRFSGLPLIVGKGADVQATKLLNALEQYPALQSRMRAAIFVAKRRWNLKLAEGTDIKLPEQNYESALKKLAELDKNDGLLNRDITVVDLRLADRVVVRLTETAAKERNEKMTKKPAARRAAPVILPNTAPAIVQKMPGGRA